MLSIGRQWRRAAGVFHHMLHGLHVSLAVGSQPF